jgi:pterin-4a-carbinolamine dehydratase
MAGISGLGASQGDRPFPTHDLKEHEMGLTNKQIERLLTPVLPSRVEKVKGNTYLPQFEARAELNRTFGFGNWDSTIHSVTLIYEEAEDREKNGEITTYWRVCYRAACTLVIRDLEGNKLCEHTEWHAEESAPQPSRGEAHALALTSVESYALRRATINLGDNFGLHLYRDGQMTPLIKGTLQTTDPGSPQSQPQAAQPVPQTPDLTEDQVAALQNSLGAQVVSEAAER